MVLTLVVSVVFGIGRAVLPAAAMETLKRMDAGDWVLFGLIAVAAGLMLSSAVLLTLNPRYFLIGLMSAVGSSLLVSYGVYSTLPLLSTVAANDRILFAAMLWFAYVWVQLSILVVRAAGYRIVVGR